MVSNMIKKKEKDPRAVIKGCKADLQDKEVSMKFCDTVPFDVKEKTAISVRDGVLDYMGAEIGQQPYEKIFSVYRSPATISNTAMRMKGIPLTYEHVSVEEPAPNTGSIVSEAEMIDFIDESTSTRIAIKNKLLLNTNDEDILKERSELSLGYSAKLIPHNKYDFEQVGIMPHHLAIVSEGRCGSLCRFLDKKTVNKKEIDHMINFKDEEGKVSLEKIMEIVQSLPQVIAEIPIDQLQEFVPIFEKLATMVKPKEEVVEQPEMEEVQDEEVKEELPEVQDEEMKEKEEEEKKFSDKALKNYAQDEVKKYAQVVQKAKGFLDESYNFCDKSSEQIMEDTLSQHSTEKFEKSELAIAFKLLKKQQNYQNFGDKLIDELEVIGNKEI